MLYTGRFVLTNTAMLASTFLTKACEICDTTEAYISVLERFFNKAFATTDIEKRRHIISVMNNEGKTNLLIQLIN